MSNTVTLGGDRIGSGAGMQVETHHYERSTHNLNKRWRNTQAPGTVVPCYTEIVLPGDTMELEVQAEILTLPTTGPCFGSFKFEVFGFLAPMRLYNGKLHNNATNLGRDMGQVKWPVIRLEADRTINYDTVDDIDNAQINPSCILSYLDIRGVGIPDGGEPANPREFFGIPLLMYWDIVKNYLANKQEEAVYMVHTDITTMAESVVEIQILGTTLVKAPGESPTGTNDSSIFTITYTGTAPKLWGIMLNVEGEKISIEQALINIVDNGSEITGKWNWPKYGYKIINSWEYINSNTLPVTQPRLWRFDISTLDDMREEILAYTRNNTVFNINEKAEGLVAETGMTNPYHELLSHGPLQYRCTQEGLAVKTYQSDLFNNWLSQEWIDGINGVNAMTAVSTVGNKFTIDTFIFSKKMYDFQNRIMVGDGSMDAYIAAAWDIDRRSRSEIPVYVGGLTREIVFQEVVSNSAAAPIGIGEQPLGTLAGKGRLAPGQKGGRMTIKADEPSVLMLVTAITPRIEYTQGNKWWTTALRTYADLHTPALDQIGFEDLIAEQMAWFTTDKGLATNWRQKAVGKQPAWQNYRTNIDESRGNFAIKNNQMFMILARRYEYDAALGIEDLTTYIEPSKFNYIFAQTDISAMNFWVHVGIKNEARRKMSYRVLPNL